MVASQPRTTQTPGSAADGAIHLSMVVQPSRMHLLCLKGVVKCPAHVRDEMLGLVTQNAASQAAEAASLAGSATYNASALLGLKG